MDTTRLRSSIVRFATRKPVLFGACMTFAMLFIKLPFVPLILAVGGADTTEVVMAGGIGLILFSFLFLPVETFIGQAFPIWLSKKFGAQRWRTLIGISAFLFGLLHLPVGLGAFFVGFAGGLVLSFCWLIWREDSLKRAFWGTTFVHAAHNAIGLLLTLGIFAVT